VGKRQRILSRYMGDVIEKSQQPPFWNFNGPAIANAIVVRVDLNGYSKWARENTLTERVQMLNDYYQHVIPLAYKYGGAFYRDEGDCIVVVYSTYFSRATWTFDSVEAFCMLSAARDYAGGDLSANGVDQFLTGISSPCRASYGHA
jgi:hypothetical protein